MSAARQLAHGKRASGDLSVSRHVSSGKGTSSTHAFKASPQIRLQALRLAFLVALILGCFPLHAGEIIDRIVAMVNGHIILQSDWDDAIRYEAFMDNRDLSALSVADRKAALDRLIDQELLREQMRSSDLDRTSSEEDVFERIKQIRTQYEAKDDARWQAILAEHKITGPELKRRVATQLDMMRLVDERLRPTIQIDSKSIESYYQQSLLPQLKQAGSKSVPLADVSPKIKELLTQQKLDQLLTAWLQNLRATSQIRTQPDSRDQGLLQ
jgi:peptidyl-prolyl cis-trans isomerase SurA